MRLRVLLMVLIIPGSILAQKNTYKGFPSLIWPRLYDVSFIKGTDQHGEYDKPVFSQSVKDLAGKEISLPGYMVPFETGVKGSVFMLSSLPLNACFFCGVGGPESVVEVHLKKQTTYTEKPVEVQGILRLNDTDPDKMMYILEAAEITGAPGF
jgi:hypothetical protein